MMKRLTLTILALMTSTFVINAQEIIKTKPIEQIEVKSPTFRYPEAKGEISKKDSSVVITIYCGPRKLNENQMHLYIIKNEEKYYKIILSDPLKSINPNHLDKIYYANKLDDKAIFVKNSEIDVIIIEFKNEFLNENLISLKTSDFKLIK